MNDDDEVDLGPRLSDDCAFCGEDASDSPLFIGVMNEDFTMRHGHKPVHVECQIREVLGGWGHHLDHAYWCGERGDPDAGLSLRESARRVHALVTAAGSDEQPD